MTFCGPKELADSLRVVCKNTLQIADDIPEAQYGFKPTPDCRSVAQLPAHIALGYRFRQLVHADERHSTLAGIDVGALIARMREEEGKGAAGAQAGAALSGETPAAPCFDRSRPLDHPGVRL